MTLQATACTKQSLTTDVFLHSLVYGKRSKNVFISSRTSETFNVDRNELFFALVHTATKKIIL